MTGGKKALRNKNEFAGRRVAIENEDVEQATAEIEMVQNVLSAAVGRKASSSREVTNDDREDSEWETFHSTEHNREYFVHKKTRRSSWVKEL